MSLVRSPRVQMATTYDPSPTSTLYGIASRARGRPGKVASVSGGNLVLNKINLGDTFWFKADETALVFR